MTTPDAGMIRAYIMLAKERIQSARTDAYLGNAVLVENHLTQSLSLLDKAYPNDPPEDVMRKFAIACGNEPYADD